MNRNEPRDLCQRTFLFACDIVAFCCDLSKEPGASRQIAGQLLRSGTSVGANAEEAKAAYTRRDFACKNSLILREARESWFWLRVIAANKLAPNEKIDPLLTEANELISIYTTVVRRSKQPLKLGVLVSLLFSKFLLLSSKF
jgi:four helix bundle protein